VHERFGSMYAWLRPPIRTCGKWSRKGDSAPTSSIA
jgi:hypothetical protein